MVLLPLILALLALSSVHAQQNASVAVAKAEPRTTPLQQRNVDGDGDGDAVGNDLASVISEVFLQPDGIDEGVAGVDQNNGDPDDGGHTDTVEGVASSDCQCVPYYLCSNNTIVTDGVGIIDIRITDSDCTSYINVCCGKQHILIPEPVINDGFPEGPVNPSGPMITHSLPIRTECGQRNTGGVGFRITGDENGEAQFGEFPWMVAVLRVDRDDVSDKPKRIYRCGGSLINRQVVMTAAHCVARQSTAEELTIRAGEWDTQTNEELLPYQDRNVREIVVHEGYYAGALYNDIALLILDRHVDPAENIGTVCLPDQGENMDNRRCFASGWGKDLFGKQGEYQVILKKIELPVVSRPKCVMALRKTRLGAAFRLHESFLCAGGEPNRDTCKGDGGSPLVCPLKTDQHHYVQSGIVAWGIGCGENNVPGVYVNVALFRNWIDDKLAHHHLDTASYRRPN